MAVKYVTIGSMVNVHIFDDGGPSAYAFDTDGQMLVGTAPTNPNEVLRLSDLPTIGELITSDAVIADHTIVRGDGGARKIQDSNVTINDAGSISVPVGETVDGVDISVHAANVNAHHAQVHAYPSHSDVDMTGLANDDLAQYDNPSGNWQAKDIAEVIAGQDIAPGNIVSTGEVGNSKVKLTSLGGLAISLTNKTGANSVAGQLVETDGANNDAVALTGLSDVECIGVFLDAGIADGAEAWVVVSGIADVMFEDNHGPTRGDWVETSGNDVGTAFSQASPAAAPTHFREIGHCIETVAAGGGGTFVNARCVLHFN